MAGDNSNGVNAEAQEKHCVNSFHFDSLDIALLVIIHQSRVKLITGVLPNNSQYTLRLRFARPPQTINEQV